LEISRFVKACGICICWLPSKISDGLISGIITAKYVDIVLGLCLPSTNNIQSNFKPCIPPFICQLRPVLCCPASIKLVPQGGTVSVGVGDVCEEELTAWTDFELKVVSGVAVGGRDEYLDDIFLPEWVVAVFKVRNYFLINAAPFDMEVLIVVAE
jgi:hypothetical protein